MSRARCYRCENQGLIRVNYHSGEPFDLAICDCPAGLFWNRQGELFIRKLFRLSASNQVAWVEDLDVEQQVFSSPIIDEAFIAAGKIAKRAKL